MLSKRKISILLIVCILAASLIGCGTSEKTPEEETEVTDGTTDPEAQEEIEEEAEEEETEDDPFPGADLGGATIKLWDVPNPEEVDEAKKEMWEERQAYVEEKFNCKLDFSGLDGVEWNDIPEAIITSVAAGDPIIDFGGLSRYFLNDLVVNDVILDVTEEVEKFELPKEYYEGFCQWKDKTYGFFRCPILPWGSLVYNRDMIKAAGMEKTPGEMFKEGKWSYEDFYDYCKELDSKLPEDTDAFGIHVLHWARDAGFANGASMMDPETYVPTYTSQGFYDAVELLQKMILEGIAVAPPEVEREDGTTGYDWNAVQEGFGEEKLAITHADEWDFEGFAAKFDYGIVPPPWGPNVTIENNDYTTLSDEYTSYVKDCGVYVVVKGAEKKATPEQYKNLLFSYWPEFGELLIENQERVANGEPITFDGQGTPRNFTTDLDIELWDWYITKSPKFDPMDTTAQSAGWFRALSEVGATDKDARSAFEAVIGEDTFALIEAGLVDENDLPEELKQKVEEYKETAPSDTESEE